MKKFSGKSFGTAVGILLSLCVSSLAGWLLFSAVGHGREYYQTSTPEQLYGAFGWFSISHYFLMAFIIGICLFCLLVVTGSFIFDLKEEATEMER